MLVNAGHFFVGSQGTGYKARLERTHKAETGFRLVGPTLSSGTHV